MKGVRFSVVVVHLMVALKIMAIPPPGLCWRPCNVILFPDGTAMAMFGADPEVSHVSVRKRMSGASLSSRS